MDSKFGFGSGCHLNDSEMSSESMNYKSNMCCGVNISWYVKVSRMGLGSESMVIVCNDQCERYRRRDGKMCFSWPCFTPCCLLDLMRGEMILY